MIHFKEVTQENFEAVINLKMKDSQIDFLESNLYSLAEAKVFDYLEPRAIYHNEDLIGFMLYYFQPHDVSREMGPGEGKHEVHSDGMDYVYFKRLMLDEKWQGRGLGRAAMEAAFKFFVEEYPSIGFVELMHYKDNEGGATLYESAGYALTGETRKTLRPGTTDQYDEEVVRRRGKGSI